MLRKRLGCASAYTFTCICDKHSMRMSIECFSPTHPQTFVEGSSPYRLFSKLVLSDGDQCTEQQAISWVKVWSIALFFNAHPISIGFHNALCTFHISSLTIENISIISNLIFGNQTIARGSATYNLEMLLQLHMHLHL